VPESLADVFDDWDLLSVVATSRDEQATAYVATVEKDGQFQIHDVPPGEYDLKAGLYAPPPEGKRGEWSLVAGSELVFEVLSTDLDLGTVALEPKAE
jgi:hypothetical protein